MCTFVTCYVCSAAVMILDSVQKEIVELSNKTENLKQNISTNLVRHHQHLWDVQELLNTAKVHKNQTEHHLMNFHTNLEQYNVSDSLELS